MATFPWAHECPAVAVCCWWHTFRGLFAPVQPCPAFTPPCQLLQPPHRALATSRSCCRDTTAVWFQLFWKNIFYCLCVCTPFLGFFLCFPSSFPLCFVVLLVPWARLAIRQAREADANSVPVVWTKLPSLPLLLLMPSFISSSPFPCLTDSSIGNQQRLCSGGVLPQVPTID